MAPKVLVVLTSADKLPKTGAPAGWYLPELAHPYEVFSGKAEIVIASPKGGVAPLDQGSVEAFKADPSSVAFLNDPKAKALWQNTKPIKEFLGRAAEFDAIFFPGGHGPMIDLAVDQDSIKLVQEFEAAGKLLTAVCHGPAAFVNVDGLLKGKTVTAFSNAEEESFGPVDAMPFSLEDSLVKAGATFVKADEPLGPKVVTSGRIITGQNPASSKEIAETILKALTA